MTDVRVSFVDVYPVRQTAGAFELLILRRAAGGRSPGAWEVVHGSVEPGERPPEAALRELGEETGLVAERFYNLSRVELFYRHRTDEIGLIPVFAAFVRGGPVRLSAEHDDFAWLPFAEARPRLAWPRERRALDDLTILLGTGDAGALEDVLRIAAPDLR
ncbi:MAG TPA: NUDIX domain-containing protein [Gemmatimonadales bacterium]|nr:NUDIX domain-containing protein [Gemmatimonadales bacterium]